MLSQATIFVWGIFFLFFPLLFLTNFTDVFVIPKQILLCLAALLSMVLWAARLFVSGKVSIRRTFFDVPLLLFAAALLLSAIFSIDRFDSLTAVAPVLFGVIGFFSITNVVRKENAALFLLASFVLSAIICSLLIIFSFVKVYPLPLAATHFRQFTPFGSLLEQFVYLLVVLLITLYFALPVIKGKTDAKTISAVIATLILFAGIIITGINMVQNPPVLLPFETGFQTAFAAISQDSGRIAQGFFFGSGYGTYDTDFTRFKQPAFNANQTLWTVPFSNSSSYILELLATGGFLGIMTFLFLLFRIVVNPSKKFANPIFLSLLTLALATFLLPFSFIEVTLLLMVLGLFANFDGLRHTNKYFDVELHVVALKKGLLSFEQERDAYENTNIVAYGIGIVFLVLVGLLGYLAGTYVIANAYFQRSLIEAAMNNGSATYQDEATAINIFPYQSIYYRIFSQTNIALANALSSSFTKNGSKPTQQQQNTLYQFIQQAITTGKQATILSPLSAADWQNLSSVYRSLIGVGQNADSFAVLASQQAAILDPSNPQEYIALGGIYYQLGQYDSAIRQFQTATNLNPSYPNAYYNLGHAYEQKGDFQNALSQYQIVKSLVTSQTDKNQITADINTIQSKIKNNTQQQAPTAQQNQSLTTPVANPTSTILKPTKKLDLTASTSAPISISPTP